MKYFQLPKKSIKAPVIPQIVEESATKSLEFVLTAMKTGVAGLTQEDAATRLENFGKNDVAQEKAPHWISQLWRATANPFNAVLFVLICVSFVTDVYLAPTADEQSYKTIFILFFMISVSTLLRFFTEFKSTRAAESLKAMVHTTATVIRRYSEEMTKGARMEIPLSDLVPGDIVQLSAGDMVPGDVRLMSSKDLFVSQSILTGESMPVEKSDTLANISEKMAMTKELSASINPLEHPSFAFLGTNIVSGTATAVVLATGKDTYFGSMAKRLMGHRSETSFDKGVKSVSYLLIRFMLVMVPIIFLINGFVKGNWMEAFLFGIAVAVGLTPEMLPMIVSSNLAKGALTLAKKKCIIKRINSIQNLGAMDILCTDKTGTLTRDKIVLERYVDGYGKKSQRVLDYAYLNSFHQTGLKNLLDRAILNHVDTNGIVAEGRHFEKLDEIPFDFNRKRMSVVLNENETSHLLVCKGAVEEVLGLCTHVLDSHDQGANYRESALNEERTHEAKRVAQEMNLEGIRVIAVAIKKVPVRELPYSVADEVNLTFVGFAGFLDPPKESAAPALKMLQEHGVTVKVLTGDSDLIARNVCHQVGLGTDRLLLGSQIDKISDEELPLIAENTDIFAKLSPLQKSRIIRALQTRGHTVGFLGDGINDAAALRDADVGISVDSAADIAKESSDIIMLEKDLMVLEEGVLEGRRVFGNIIKYIKMTASSNFGNVFSVLIASAFIPFLPMLAIQLLIQNTLYDLSQTTIPFDHVDPEYLKKPRKWFAGDIGRFMIFIGPISSIFDIVTFCLMWYVYKANSAQHQALFQSGWFVVGLLTQTLVVHMIRTEKIPFIQSRATWPVVAATVIIMLFGIVLPFIGLGRSVGMVALPLSYFPWLVGILFCYCGLTQVVKTWYIRRFGTWL